MALGPVYTCSWAYQRARGNVYLKLHNVGVLAALAEVQELPAQHCLAVLTARDEPAQQSTSALLHNDGRTNVTCCLPVETVRNSTEGRVDWLKFNVQKGEPVFQWY